MSELTRALEDYKQRYAALAESCSMISQEHAAQRATIQQQAETIAAHDGIKTKLEIKIQEQAERIKQVEENRDQIATQLNETCLELGNLKAELARLESDLYWAASQHASILGHRTPEDEARTRAILQQGQPKKEV